MRTLLLFISCLSTNISADQQWFDRHSEGWFWYESIIEPEKEENKINAQNERPQPLTTTWIRNNISQYLDRAIDHPSKENVSNYLYLDRLVKEKAERFAHVGKQVIESDPMLDENVRRPISPAAAKIKDDMAYRARDAVLKKIARVAGLLFYYQGHCDLCRLQAQTVALFREFYDFKLIPVSTDGFVLPGLPDSRVETTPHPKLNIKTYPALFLMQPPDNIVLLRQGTSSFTALTERMANVAFEQGWIDINEFQKTRINQDVWSTEPLEKFPPIK